MRARWWVGVAFLLMAGAVVWFAASAARLNQRIALLEAQVRVRQPAGVVAPVPPAQAPAHDAPAEPRQRGAAGERRIDVGVRTDPETEELRSKLQDSQAALSRLQSRVDELDGKLQDVAGERARWTAAESEARSQVAELTRRWEEVAAVRPGLETRLRELEAENGRLREQGSAGVQRTAQLGKLAGEWHDLAQRQQIYLANALRRYRELTDLFRRLPGMLEVKGNGPELARIQSAISMADEDFRQLNDLNMRLGRVQKQLAAMR